MSVQGSLKTSILGLTCAAHKAGGAGERIAKDGAEATNPKHAIYLITAERSSKRA